MSAQDNGGPAFPCEVDGTQPFGRQTGTTVWQAYGLSQRDYFAVHASDEDIKAQAEVIRAQMIQQNGLGILPDNWHCTARYMHADAMLKAREQ